MRLEVIGRFSELGDGDSAPSIVDAVGVLQGVDRFIVAAYLADGGVSLSAVPGLSPDVIDGSLESVPRSHATDGEFVWRRSLAHYVSKYGLEVPKGLIERARTDSPPPTFSKAEWDEIGRRLADLS